MDFTSTETLEKMMEILRAEYPHWQAPIVTFVAESRGTPYKILISTLLSLRTKDDCTRGAVNRLFGRVQTMQEMLTLSAQEIEKLIYPVGFYKTKALRILETTAILLEKFNGQVPDDLDTLLTLPGVGRKTANLVITLGYGMPGICVDTHVHRISNRFGFVRTKTPEKTEFALREKLPPEWWIPYNDILVAFGQTLCKPISPHCSTCPVKEYCPRIGVDKSR